MTEHKIYTEEIDEERSYWECSCGASGSTASWKVDIASDKHIKDEDTRVDTNKPFL